MNPHRVPFSPSVWRDHRLGPISHGGGGFVKRRFVLLTLVLGGARSGKSRQAETLVTALPGPWVYIATAEARDAEMAARIAAHCVARGPGWRTIEAPLDLPAALEQAGGAPALVDCLTLWLSNLLLAGRDVAAATAALLAALEGRAAPTVLVSNEVGLGIVPDNALARAFRDEAGRLHQKLAERADRVLFMVAGLPMTVKG
jgi:adenosyl cobinamide kinase/adenosyl cobinamide phosphate guanylyltransferase